MSDYEGYPGRAPIPKQTVKEAECVEGTVRKSAKDQAGSNWDHLVDSSKVLEHPLTIPKTDCPA
jgi:hypothetical protein